VNTPLAAVLCVLTSLVIVTAAMAGSLTTEASGVRVELESSPDTPVTDRRTVYTVRLADPDGRPVTGANLTLTGRMADGMSAASPLRPVGEPGSRVP
jgi:hypothetical protein